MSTLQNLILVSLLPLFFSWGSEEATLKEVRIDMKTGYYHLATVRLERLLKEYPKSPHRREMLPLIIKSYVLSKREQEAIPHIHTFLNEFPTEAATLDPQFLKLLPPPPTQPAESIPLATASAAPAEPVVGKEVPPSVSVKKEPVEMAPPAAKSAALPVQEPAPPAAANPPRDYPQEMIEKSTPVAVPSATAAAASVQKAETPSAEADVIHAPPVSDEPKTGGAELPEEAPQPSVPAAPPGEITPPAETAHLEYYTLSSGEIVDAGEQSRLLAKLRAAGLEPQVSEGTRGIVMHRLVAGCYPSNSAALQRKQELAGLSKGVFVFREGESFCTAAGSFRVVKIVEHERKRLAAKGIVARIVPFSMDIPFWSVTVGWFPDAATAEMARRRLAADGLKLGIQLIKK